MHEQTPSHAYFIFMKSPLVHYTMFIDSVHQPTNMLWVHDATWLGAACDKIHMMTHHDL